MDMLKNRNVMAGVVFVLSTAIVMTSLYIAKPAFCCQAQVNSSDPVEVNWGIVSGMSAGIGAIAAGVAFMLMPAPAGGASPAPATPMAFAYRMGGGSLPMGMKCSTGCGMNF